MDISDVLSHFEPFDLSVTRYAAGSYNADGNWVAGSTSTVTRAVVITPASFKQIEHLPEGLRTRQVLQVFADGDLRTANEPAGTQADTFTLGGKTFEVQSIEDWSANGGFWRALAVKVQAS